MEKIIYAFRSFAMNDSVYTAWGTPLRGSLIGLEGSEPDYTVSRGDLRALRENGLNALHIYLETPYTGKPVGEQAAKCDAIVRLAAKYGVYVVITIGSMLLETDSDEQYLYDFWEFYAPRYKDRKNVIYEIANEHGWPENGPDIIANTYKIIRRHAPDTMILMFSFAVSLTPEYAFPWIKQTERLAGITWANEALAFHCYEGREDEYGADWLVEVVDAFTGEGYPVINTELPNRFEQTDYPDLTMYRVLEKKGVSWLGFVYYKYIALPTHWRGQFEAAGLAWRPDYGNWPAADAVYPFDWQDAVENIAHTTAQINDDGNWTHLSLAGGDYVTYRRLNFGSREPLSFEIGYKSVGGGSVTVHEGGPDGPALGSCTIPPANSRFTTASGDIMAAVGGLPDISFVFAGDGELLIYDWRFTLPKQVSYADPRKIVDAASYPFRSGGIVRRPSADAGSGARLQVSGVTNGSALVYDFVYFPKVEAIPFHIRAMPLAGGAVEIYAGEFKHDSGIFYNDVFPIGRVEIGGKPGIWADFACELDFLNTNFINYIQDDNRPRWDMALVFTGEDGEELFALSEFYIGHEKPDRAPTLDPKVITGRALDVGTDYAIIDGSRFYDIAPRDIIEAGMMYHGEWLDFSEADRQKAAAASPFTVRISLRPGEEFHYRAYVKTASGTYLGGVRRVFTPPDPA